MFYFGEWQLFIIFGVDPGFSIERGRQHSSRGGGWMISRKFCSMGQGADYNFSDETYDRVLLARQVKNECYFKSVGALQVGSQNR